MIKTSFPTAFILLLSVCTFGQTRFYVKSDATGLNDGSSWVNAYTDLRDAISLTNPGDTLWIASGVYKPTKTANRNSRFEIFWSVNLIGGFNGNESTLSERNWASNPTIMSGNIGNPNDSTDNSYNILYMYRPDSTTLIDGIIFEHGNANFNNAQFPDNELRNYGGAVYIDASMSGSAYPTFKNCTFRRNYARFNGGAVYANGDKGQVAPSFQHCTFQHNNCGGRGAAVAKNGNASINRPKAFVDCKIEYNRGSAIFILDSLGIDTIEIINCDFRYNTGICISVLLSNFSGTRFTIDSCVFEENKLDAQIVFASGGLISFQGGASINYGSITNCIFTRNLTSSHMIYILGSGGSLFDPGVLRLEHLEFTENIAHFRLIYANMYASSSTLRDITVYNNDLGSGIHVIAGWYQNHLYLSDIWFTQNKISTFLEVSSTRFTEINHLLAANNTIRTFYPYGLEWNYGNYYQTYRFGMRFSNCIQVNMRNCTVDSDSFPMFSTKATASAIAQIPETGMPKFNFYNNAFMGRDSFWGAYPSIVQFEGTFNNNWISPKFKALCNDLPTGLICENNLFDTDPLFTDTAQGDFHLLPCSPLVDSGNDQFLVTDKDIAGAPRIQGAHSNIGALESVVNRFDAIPQIKPTCSNESTGNIDFEVLSGCVPLSFQWAGPDNTTGNSLNNLSGGEYLITVTDAAGDTYTYTLSVPAWDSPSLQLASGNIICGGLPGGNVNANTENGTAPYHYVWNSGDTLSQITNLSAGFYTATVTDANGCRDTAGVEIKRQGGLNILVDLQPVTCHGYNDADITILPQNGKPPFGYLWQDGSTLPELSNIGPGLYAGTLTDDWGCMISWQLPISEPDALQAGMVVTDASGPDEPDGIINIQPVGGMSPYQILWSDGNDNFLISNVLPGNYPFTLTDNNGCATVDTAVVKYTTAASGLTDMAARLDLFPNPADQYIDIRIPARHQLSEAIILDASQRILHRLSVSAQSTLRIGIADLPPGIYLVQLRGDRQFLSRSFMVSRQ